MTDSKKNQLSKWYFYLLTDGVSAYVIMTRESRESEVYKRHYRGEIAETAGFFKVSARPRMYLLETDEITESEAYGRWVCWSTYFKQKGYDLVDQEAISRIAYPHPNDAARLERLKNVPIEKLVADEADVSVTIDLSPTQHKLPIVVGAEEYKQILYTAADSDMTLKEYCAARFWRQTVKKPALSELFACRAQAERAIWAAESVIKQGVLQGHPESAYAGVQDEIAGLRVSVDRLEKAILSIIEE